MGQQGGIAGWDSTVLRQLVGHRSTSLRRSRSWWLSTQATQSTWPVPRCARSLPLAVWQPHRICTVVPLFTHMHCAITVHTYALSYHFSYIFTVLSLFIHGYSLRSQNGRGLLTVVELPAGIAIRVLHVNASSDEKFQRSGSWH